MAQQFSLKKEEFDYELEVRIFYQIFGLKYKLWSGISDKKMTNAAIENKEQIHKSVELHLPYSTILLLKHHPYSTILHYSKISPIKFIGTFSQGSAHSECNFRVSITISKSELNN